MAFDPKAQIDEGRFALALSQERKSRGVPLGLNLAISFDPNAHPRDLKGRFKGVLSKLEPGQSVNMPDGTTVTRRPDTEKGGMDFKVQAKNGEVLGEHNNPDRAASRALHHSATSKHKDSLGGGVNHRDVDSAIRAAKAVEKSKPSSSSTKSVARSDAGNLRNFKAMSDSKFDALEKDMAGSDDSEALDAIRAERSRRSESSAAGGGSESPPNAPKPTAAGGDDGEKFKVVASKNGSSAPPGQWTQHDSGDLEIEMPDGGPTARISESEIGGSGKWSASVFPDDTSNDAEERHDFDSATEARKWAEGRIDSGDIQPGTSGGGGDEDPSDAMVSLGEDHDPNDPAQAHAYESTKEDWDDGSVETAQEIRERYQEYIDDYDPEQRAKDEKDMERQRGAREGTLPMPDPDSGPEDPAQAESAFRAAGIERIQVEDASPTSISFNLPGGDDEYNDWSMEKASDMPWVVTSAKPDDWVLTQLPHDAYDDSIDDYEPELLMHTVLGSSFHEAVGKAADTLKPHTGTPPDRHGLKKFASSGAEDPTDEGLANVTGALHNLNKDLDALDPSQDSEDTYWEVGINALDRAANAPGVDVVDQESGGVLLQDGSVVALTPSGSGYEYALLKGGEAKDWLTEAKSTLEEANGEMGDGTYDKDIAAYDKAISGFSAPDAAVGNDKPVDLHALETDEKSAVVKALDESNQIDYLEQSGLTVADIRALRDWAEGKGPEPAGGFDTLIPVLQDNSNFGDSLSDKEHDALDRAINKMTRGLR